MVDNGAQILMILATTTKELGLFTYRPLTIRFVSSAFSKPYTFANRLIFIVKSEFSTAKRAPYNNNIYSYSYLYI